MNYPFLFHPQVTPWFQASADTLLLTLFSERDTPIRHVWVRHEPDNEEYLIPMKPVSVQDRLQVWQATLPLSKVEEIHLYCFKCLTDETQWWLHGAGISSHIPPREQHLRFNSQHQPPAWVQDQVFYQIFPDRFCDGDPSLSVKHHEYQYGGKAVISKEWGAPVSPHEEGHGASEFYGGDLVGIDKKLDYLHSLGVTALYLNPIFDSPSNHKYDTQDYLNVDRHLGSNAQFADLTRHLHQRGMKIILDAVVNHTSTQHPWFCSPEGAHTNPDSPWRSFYTFDSNGDYVSWKGIRSLPKLDFASEQVQDAIYRADDAILRYWMRAPYQIDGWRFDVIHMLGERGSAKGNRHHVQAIRRAVKQENPDAYVLGEHFFEASQWLQGDQEDGAMNYYGFAHPIRAFLAGQDIAYHPIHIRAEELDRWLKLARAHIPFKNQLAQFNLLDSHDTARFLYLLGEDKQTMQLAVTLLLTYIGVPSIYYGDEVGLSGGNDPDCRRCFPWDTTRWDHALHDHYQRLIQIRRQRPSLRRGDIQTLYAGSHSYVFARTLQSDQVLVACNRHPTDARTLNLPLWQTASPASRFTDALNGDKFERVEGMLQVTVPANSARVLLSS
ncbi:maltodextrin glucosidase [Aeromonas cavernicola]|uniref:Maltodextrin glucosidase n=1 Tax=Aeromonas cavernicola TaxID=1006623 RepID=A0A2H9U981_9GAMM|nr:maltodextrin glucosidase [Aeromonas cavernicola]PJG60577.1 maltodextrin glucosidase [Aeromonas cavernicola]